MGARPTEGVIGEWYEANPLRKWRRSVPSLTIRKVAEGLDVNVSQINKWEIGISTPKVSTMWNLAEFMERKPSDLYDEWAAWLQRRPARVA